MADNDDEDIADFDFETLEDLDESLIPSSPEDLLPYPVSPSSEATYKPRRYTDEIGFYFTENGEPSWILGTAVPAAWDAYAGAIAAIQGAAGGEDLSEGLSEIRFIRAIEPCFVFANFVKDHLADSVTDRAPWLVSEGDGMWSECSVGRMVQAYCAWVGEDLSRLEDVRFLQRTDPALYLLIAFLTRPEEIEEMLRSYAPLSERRQPDPYWLEEMVGFGYHID